MITPSYQMTQGCVKPNGELIGAASEKKTNKKTKQSYTELIKSTAVS